MSDIPAVNAPGIDKLVWTFADNFETSETGYFWMHEADFKEMLALFGIEDFLKELVDRAEELGKDLIFEIDHTDKKVKVSWKPAKDADGR